MDVYDIIAILATVTAVFSYLNYRFIKLPATIGVMLISLAFSLVLIFMSSIFPSVYDSAYNVLSEVHFDETLMHGMLSVLLFAGALHVNINDLMEQKFVILSLATFGVVISTFLIGTGIYFIFDFMSFNIPYIYCLLFGALISPTDPIAVLGILKTVKVPKSLEIKIAGESLFNDGIGVVVFIVLLEIATGQHEFTIGHTAYIFLLEAVGGGFLGLFTGWLVYLMMKSIDNYQVEILLTLALVFGGYTLANTFHMSGPICVVISGLMIGNRGRRLAMSEKTLVRLDTFWELLDEILNAVLFVLIGLEILIISSSMDMFIIGIFVIPLILASRFISVGIPVTILKRFRNFSPGAVRILVWGGLRGGISVALALSLPNDYYREILLLPTYVVVVFSVIVQGLTIKPLVKSMQKSDS